MLNRIRERKYSPQQRKILAVKISLRYIVALKIRSIYAAQMVYISSYLDDIRIVAGYGIDHQKASRKTN